MALWLRTMMFAVAAFLAVGTMAVLPAGGAAAEQPAMGAASAGAGAIAASTSTSAVDNSYRLGVADKVRLIVFNEESLSGEFVVGDQGTLSLPLIGAVPAQNRTPGEVIADIEKRLGDGFLREPRVSLEVLTYRPFYIMGEVTKPGEYPFSAGLTILNAVARAEGFTYRANKRKVFIRRAGEAAEKVVSLTPDIRVYPGDTVRIGERYF